MLKQAGRCCMREAVCAQRSPVNTIERHLQCGFSEIHEPICAFY